MTALLALLGVMTVATATVPAQIQVRARVPDRAQGAIVPAAQEPAEDDLGPQVRLIESTSLDRFLRKARGFLQRQDWAGAIKVLQDVVEGHTEYEPGSAEDSEAPGSGTAPADPAKAPAAPQDPRSSQPSGTERKPGTGQPGAGQPGAGGVFQEENDPHRAVFSSDGRLYHPVLQLCHEQLARMPPEGRDLYVAQHEVAATRALEAALEKRDVRALEHLAERWFVTASAGKALLAAGDLHMDAGRFRAALQAYRKLLAVYPESLREAAGIAEQYLLLKMAVCHQMQNEAAKARGLLEELRTTRPEGVVRMQGEAVAVADLAAAAPFASSSARGEDSGGGAGLAPDDENIVRTPTGDAPANALRSIGEVLVPLWQHRFAEPAPYAPGRSTDRQNIVWMPGQQPAALVAPRARLHAPGASCRLVGDRLVFLDHYRLRVQDARTGMMLAETDGALRPPEPQQNVPRSRVASYDWAAGRVVYDDERFYVVLGPERRSQGQNVLLENELVAYRRDTLEPAWSTSAWQEGSEGFADVTFLSAPTIADRRLFAPVLHRGVYALQCLDATSGKPLFRVHVHSGGTELTRAPGTPVVVHGDVVYVATNAGALAAIDAYTGSVRWIRRYERLHPLRPLAVHVPQRRNMRGMIPFQEADLPGFAPGNLLLHDGLLLLAPCDGRVLLALDSASGDVVWMLSKTPDMRYLMGIAGGNLYVAGQTLTCIEARTGIRLWELEVPADAVQSRGVLTDALVAMPGEGQLHLLPIERGAHAAPDGGWKSRPLQQLASGADPLAGPANLFAFGPYVAACYEAGIDVHASVPALEELARGAADPLRRAGYLVQIGDLTAAVDVLLTALSPQDGPQAPGADDPVAPAPAAAGPDEGSRRRDIAERALELSRELAVAMAAHGAREEALAILNRCRAQLDERAAIELWHLARLEVFRTLGDLEGQMAEQEALYRTMSGYGADRDATGSGGAGADSSGASGGSTGSSGDARGASGGKNEDSRTGKE